MRQRNSFSFARPRLTETVIAGGITIGVLDLLDAIVFWGLYRGVSPVRIMQSIASGLLGSRAYEGGAATALLGVLLHFFIAFVVAAVYAAAAARIPALVRRPVISGLLYGLSVFIVMQYVVLPLSMFRVRPLTSWPLVNAVAIHLFGVGLPIALIAARPRSRRLLQEA